MQLGAATLAAIILGTTGCRALLGFEEPLVGEPDAAAVGDDAPNPDAGLPCVLDGIDECAVTPMPDLVLADATIDTDSDPRCVVVSQTGGLDACLFDANRITVASGARVAVIGSRPLILFSRDALDVEGTVDASSSAAQRGAAANAGACVGAMPGAEPDLGGAGGGAGGSFAGAGGTGGLGDSDNTLGGDGTALGAVAEATVAAPNRARGGCAGSHGGNESAAGGQGGIGGAGGGALWLVGGSQVSVSGSVLANGAGGAGGMVQSGGGGGGSGGSIQIAAPSIVIGGVLAANGGGGGEGGVRIGATPIPGNPGHDGNPSATAATGGSGANVFAGDGGSGSSQAVLDGQVGAMSQGGAGGGGGGAGYILLRGTVSSPGIVSPPAS